MLYRITLISLLILANIVSTPSMHIYAAVSSQSGSDVVTSNEITEPLELKNLKVIDSKTIRVLFSEEIDVTSVVLKIMKQSDNSALNIDELKAMSDSLDSFDVILADNLEEGTSYTMTVLAAVATSGATITDGGAALKEFVTPSPLTQATSTLNAPPNPAAVTAKEDVKDIATPSVDTESTTKKTLEKETPVPTEELPLTGPAATLWLLLIFPMMYIFLRKYHA